MFLNFLNIHVRIFATGSPHETGLYYSLKWNISYRGFNFTSESKLVNLWTEKCFWICNLCEYTLGLQCFAITFNVYWWGRWVPLYIKLKDPNTGRKTNRSFTFTFYSYRLMVKKSKYNHLIYLRWLLNQYIVDMNSKINSKTQHSFIPIKLS